ncbi:hypothetical protein PYW08_008007 [Mythimna loreyi]|uniref:Uncharacterized protein n=1 Tax=Mythimna loreyi TaxID=667449 RepID=A0ACC2QB55_9NEOP|nr:hypothetical protein PYW08_008007 [Mythimna loreyi]
MCLPGFQRPGAFLPWFKEVTGIDLENLQEDDTTTTIATPTTTTIPGTTATPTTINLTTEDQNPEDNTTLTPDSWG